MIIPNIWKENNQYISGWWLNPTPLKNVKYELVNWDDDIPNIWKTMFQSINQICAMD